MSPASIGSAWDAWRGAAGKGSAWQGDRVRIVRWWRARSSTERFDLSTRWSLYGAAIVVPLTLVPPAAAAGRGGAELLMVLGLAQLVICLRLLHVVIEHRLGGPRPSTRLLAAAAATTAVAVAAAVALLPPSAEASRDVPSVVVYVGILALVLVAVLAPVLPMAVLAAVAVAGLLLVPLTVQALTDPPPGVLRGVAGFTGASLAGIFATYRFSVWMVVVVWELDRGRAVAARLAVAEERLRFSRDLHDVLGRNLSVIAVKSELAGQLARRGEPRAAEEMMDVRRVAAESLREVREVVRGYRAADLGAELAGARSVLAAAGVECRVIGDGAGLPEPVQAALGWVVREGTTNVIRHSGARSCTIDLDVTGGAAVLRMVNDGARPAAGTGGSGLTGLGERLAGVGGVLRAERDGDRFVVEATVPVG